MKFAKKERHGPREITPRQVSAYARSCRQKQEKFPLFAAAIAEGQAPADEEMARRVALDVAMEQRNRNDRAADWRKVRRRLFDLPADARAVVLARYNANQWYPRQPGFLASLIWGALKGYRLDAAQVQAPADAREQIAALNDRARAQDTFTRRRFGYSPAVMAWLAPNFTPDEDYARPNVWLHADSGWRGAINQRVSDHWDFSHNIDPTGERRCGLFEFLGVWFRFEILCVGHDDNQPSAAPWNIDLSRRLVWIGLEDEAVDIESATYAGGWRPEANAVDCQTL